MYIKWLRNNVLLLLVFITFNNYSQLNSDTLKEFEIVDVILELSTFSSVSLLDSNSENNTLNDVLENSSPAYIKKYGKGQLSTISIRGNSASQTQLFWNGFKMNSPTLGQSDLSLVPLFFISNASLSYSGASTVNGSGGIGGSVNLSNKLLWEKGLHTSFFQEFSSFNNNNSGLKFSFGNKRFFHQFKAFYRNGVNNFPFIDISKPNNPIDNQINNKVNQLGAQYELGFQINNKNLIQSTLYYFDSYRELPPIIGGVSNMEFQEDKNFKSFVSWKSFQEKFKADLRLSFFQESLDYTDSISSIFSKVNLNIYQALYQINFKLFKHINIESSLQNLYNSVTSNGFEDEKKRNELGFYVKADKKYKNTKVEIFGRQELIDNNFSPFIYGAGIIYNPFNEKLSLKGNFSTNYRTPTLNDLYWNPGGNIHLNPEKGWTSELSIDYKSKLKKLRNKKKELRSKKNLNLGMTGFYNKTQNWIQWQPTEFGYWKPINLKNIKNVGIEFNVKYMVENIKKTNKINVNFFYTYTDSKNESFSNGREELINKQTTYVPKHKSTLSIIYTYKKLRFSYNQIYNSKVFIDESNFSYLPHYFPANIGIAYLYSFKKIKTEIEFRAINIYDEQYHITPNRPIPGRNYSLSIKFNY